MLTGKLFHILGTITLVFISFCSVKQTAGIFWNNAAETWIEIDNRDDGVNTYFMSESGVLDLFVLPGPSPKDAVRQYATLTGTAPLPQVKTIQTI